ncbi:cholinesterase [Ephemerocybe angulata]|uniref:Carboxylic ester hydrolase n=1 Tax=Ephemerocybe angulata TaxID=980116 RepID=A0A8H6HQ13_9AGAR|nr:cholinesterase [Tulosesus angulatus]
MLAVLSLLLALEIQKATSAPSPYTLKADLSLLVQNDLNWQTASDHSGLILLDTHSTHSDAVKKCGELNEKLLSTAGPHFKADIERLLAYHATQTGSTGPQRFWVNSTDSTECKAVSLTLAGSAVVAKADCKTPLRPLCSQSAPYKRNTETNLNPNFHVQVKSKNLTITGTRDHLSFRFLGIPYANPVERFAYSEVYNKPATLSALKYGSSCAQRSTGSEDCLTLNIYTPYLPQSPLKSKDRLKPVMLWIHGGGFTDGTSSDPVFDGGNLVSRGDVVVVSINYRLGTLGFLALTDGATNGNFGLADQITALHWVQKHISSFGGDPARVTIFGQSAGAGSVRALLASPAASGLFRGAIAQSNLGGFGYAKAYSKYMKIEEQYAEHAESVVEAVGCKGSGDILECLRGVPAAALQTAPNAPRYIVVDGKYIAADELNLMRDGSGHATEVHVMFGWTRDDGSDFIGAWPKEVTAGTATAMDILTRSGLDEGVAQKALDSGAFPLPADSLNATWNLWNQTSRIATAGMFICVDQATVIAAAKHRVFPSIYAYQYDRTYVGWEPIAGTCGPAATPTHPHGDTSLPYFRCHSGELSYMFGTMGQDSLPFRDWDDLLLAQVNVDMWTSFARTYDPNPTLGYLKARGYTNTTIALAKGGKWKPVTANEKLPLRRIDSKLRNSGWVEREQCEVLGYPLEYYG